MVGRGGRVKLTEVNPHLVCVLCRGYLIDATTITECLHSFCRSCIILYLETKSYCPICEVQIHKTKPYLNLKLDKTLQDIVYKLVPGLFHSEMRRRQEFYKNHPVHDLHLHPEARGLAIDRLIYSPDDSISLSLEYYDSEREREEWTSVAADACEHASKRASSRTNIPPALTSGASTDAQIAAGSKHEQDQIQVEQNKKRYLLCPAVVTMVHLKKFVRNKYNLPDTSNVEIIYRRESLPDSYSLMDVAYIYTWKQNEPMKFYYRIHLLKTVQSIPDEESLIDSKSLKSATVPQRSSNDRSEKREKLKVNGSSKSIKHEAIDIKKKEPVKIESPIRASKINEAYSLDDEIDVVKESRSAVPNRVKPKPPAISTQRNGSIPIPSNDATNKSNADSPKIESKQQESQNIKSKFYQDPSRNILPYKSKARSTVPSEHFPTKPYKRQRVTNSKNKLSHGSPNTSKTSPKSANTVESKRTGISPSKNVSIKINIANATLAETNNSVTSTICENTMENGHSASNSLKRTNELAVENRLCTTNSNKTDHELSKSNVTIEKHLLSEALSQVARSELKSIINDQGTKFPVNSSPSSELDPINVTNNQFFSESKQLSNKSQDLSNKSVQKQVTPLKIVVQQKQSPDKNGNKTNGLNESNKSEAQKTQDTGIKSNISVDIKRSISLDKAAEELLSAVGLKPKHDLKEAFKSMNDIKEESSKENVSPEQQKNDKKETSEFSLTGLGIQRPFRSEHDEMSVNLLLSFSNGHTSNNHNLTTADQTIPEKHLPKNPSESNKAPIDQKNNLIESSNTNVTLSNKNLMIEPTTPVVSENSQDKGRSENFSSISTPINGFTVSVNNVNNKNETNITNSHKSNAIESELKISKSEVEKSNEKNEQHQSKSNPSGNTKILSYSKQKKIPEENVGLENNQIILNKINTGMQQEDKCSKSPVMTPQVTKHQNRTTKDISKTVDFLLMKSLSVSKETIATKVITSGTSQIDVLTSLQTSKMNGKCDVVSPTSSRREKNQNEATAKSIAALALTSLTGQREVTNSGIASPRRPWADGEEEEDVQNSKVRMLKRKLNRPGDCGVHVSTATRDDGLSEAKRRKLVTPDVSIELLTHPINERTANKRPLVDNKKPCPEKKPKMNIVESVNQDELRISSVEHLAASTVKIEKVAQGHLKFSALSPTLSVKENSAVEMPSGKSSPDHLRPITPKNLAGDRCGTPDITIEKMSDKKLNVSPNALSQHKRNSTSNSSNEVFAKTGVKAGIQTSCSPTVVKSDTKAKSGLGSPTTSNAEPSTSPVGQKKMPKLIEINAPARSKIEVMTADKKPTNNQNQRTGLKMTTVRKEVPIGKQMTFVKKDSNGALDLSPASVPKSRPALPPRIQQTFPSGSVDMYPAAALHLLQMQMQSRLLASQANNNMTQRKDPELSKQLKDWVRNAVNCGALPPHPLMFGPLPQQQSQQQSPPQRSNANLSSTP